MMMTSSEIEIRNYRPEDRDAVRRISYETSFLGHADALFDEPELVADALTSYFTGSEPESCFVAIKDGKIVGYLIGAKDERKMSKVLWWRIYPKLVLDALRHGTFFKSKSSMFLRHALTSFLKGEFWTPNHSADYPAIFHINIAGNHRGGGIGKKLIDHYLRYLRSHGVRGVRVSVMADASKGFFERCGFRVLFSRKRRYLRYYFGDDSTVYLMAKDLSL